MSLRKSQQVTQVAAIAVFALCSSVAAYGAGFEKSVFWSGKWSGVAGAATAGVSGAESLYFNPGGLTAGGKSNASLNISPTFSQFKAPFTGAGEVEGKRQFSPPFGALASYKLSDKLALGLGAYVGGGSKAVFENVNNVELLDFKTDLTLTELAFGAAYEITSGLRIGAAWRVSMASASLTQGGATPVVNQVQYNDLKKTKFDGFRVGAQYTGTGWGLGASYRSKTTLDLEGTAQVDAPAVAVNGATGTATFTTELPQQIALGVWFDAMSKLRTYLDYSLTEYSKVNRIAIGVTSTTIPGTFLNSMNAGLNTGWRNQHVARIGFECTDITDVPLRFGYAYTSQVTPSERVSPTFSSPGNGNDITLGAGYKISEALSFNGALNYSFASGESAATTLPVSGSTGAAAGKYSTNAYIAHLGVDYSF